MKKITSNIILLAIIIATASSCRKDHWIKGEGSNVTNIRNVSGFSGVSLGIDANVEIFRDSVFRIELIGQQNILNVITTSVNGNTLNIDLKRFTSIHRHNLVTVKVYMPDLSSMVISGSGDMNCSSQFNTDYLNVTVSGSGNIGFQGIVNNSVTASISGSGGIQIGSNGNCMNAKYSISGSGDIYSEYLKVDYTDAHISGSGDMRIHAIRQMNAHIFGSGDISYRGTPAMSVNISGSGKVMQIQ